MNRPFAILVCCSILLAACAKNETPAVVDAYDPARDYFSFANVDQFVNNHLALELDVDFNKQELRGHAVLRLQRLDPAASEVVLDTRAIHVAAASAAAVDGSFVDAAFRFGDEDPVLGTPLIITLPKGLDADEILLKVEYSTSPGASALQWLPPELTAGGVHPFLFSQSQAIHARSWVPLQDTPSVRITYDAVIHTPADLLAVMSANNDPEAERDGVYEFEMPQPIPSYLLAIAVGNINFAAIGEDTGVYAEPETLQAAAYEFADTQAMLDTAEEMFGPYRWGRYDLLILPPSFPYGGMENPRLSFLTPSLLAGDRSLVAVVAHELAHSWSGNLVTNGTWRDQWLNEGMTSYLENRLMQVIYDVDRAEVENVIDYRELLLDLETVPLNQQALAPRFDSGDPDDFQGIVHYHKGNLFLRNLEYAFGREVFDDFLNDYFNEFAFKTISTERFLDYMDAELLSKHPGKFSRADAEAWIYQPGLPENAVTPSSETLDTASAMARSWSDGEVLAEQIPAADWPAKVVVHFINSLDSDLTDERLSELDDALQLSATGNAEIARTWFIQVATRGHRDAYDEMEAHLNRYGRTRLVSPVYKALAMNGTDRELALQMFERARSNYHPITITKIEYEFEKATQD